MWPCSTFVFDGFGFRIPVENGSKISTRFRRVYAKSLSHCTLHDATSIVEPHLPSQAVSSSILSRTSTTLAKLYPLYSST